MTVYVVPIVEGQTEVGCIERLLQRVWVDLLFSQVRLQVLPASRGKRDALINPNCSDLSQKIEEGHAKLARRLRHDPVQTAGMVFLHDKACKVGPATTPRSVWNWFVAPVARCRGGLSGGTRAEALGGRQEVTERCPHRVRAGQADVGKLDRGRGVHLGWRKRLT